MQLTVKRFGLVVIAIMALLGLGLQPVPAMAATSGMLTRYPYLTDSIQSSITVNWATDTTGGTSGSLTWGRSVTATRIPRPPRRPTSR